MEVDKSILLQKQVRDNSEDLQNEFLDMKNWEEQMKRKDLELQNAGGDQVLPSIRSKKKKAVRTLKPNTDDENSSKAKRIKSYDYSAWDKFDVDKACEEINDEDKSGAFDEEEMSKEELEVNHSKATKHKEEGNIFVKQQEWTKAITCYSEAIKVFPYDAVFYANRALCHLKIDNLYSAEADCTAALQLDETYVKAYHRRATSRIALKQYREAKYDLEKILKLEPSNKEAISMLTQVKGKIEKLKPVIVTGKDLDETTSIEKKMGEKLCGGPVTNLKQQKNSISLMEMIQREPRWLSVDLKNTAVVTPIVQPPHRRSKKPLRRIVVEEVDFREAYLSGSSLVSAEEKKEEEKKEEEVNCIETKEEACENMNESDNKKQDVCIGLKEFVSEPIDTPPVPKTAVQFLMSWKRSKSGEFRYKYLKQLPDGSIHKIFQDSLESNIFSDILSILRSEFMKRKESVFRYLEDLSLVKRFRALTMFMSDADKEDLRTLFEYCKEVEGKLDNEIIDLQVKYEI